MTSEAYSRGAKLTAAAVVVLVTLVLFSDYDSRPEDALPSPIDAADAAMRDAVDGVSTEPILGRTAIETESLDGSVSLEAADAGLAHRVPWKDCFVGSPSLDPKDSGGVGAADLEMVLRSCIREGLASGPSPEEMAAWICEDQLGVGEHRFVVSEWLSMLPPETALVQLDAFQLACRRYRETFFLDGCSAYMKEQDPAWFAVFTSTVTPESAFRQEAGVAAIQLAYTLAREGHDGIRSWIEAGARGEHGGTDAQIRRAMAVAYALQETPEAALSLLDSVARGEWIAPGTRAGSELVALLLMERSRINGDASEALRIVLEALENPSLAEAAATQVLYSGTSPRRGIDPVQWSLVYERARQVNE